VEALVIFLRIIVFLVGFYIVFRTVNSALRTFVVPRGERDKITGYVFVILRHVINPLLRKKMTYKQRDRIMAYYAPVALFMLLPTWYTLVTIGYTLMYWGMGIEDLYDAFLTSGSSLLTLGFASVDNLPQLVLVFTEATIGLLLVALLIAYLPTMYTAFSRREAAVTRLEVRAGAPPSAFEFLLRHHRLQRLDQLTNIWRTWEEWFADVEESHTSLAPLVFFRSPTAGKSWVTASGAILDSAALFASTLDLPRDAQAEICIRAGYLAMRRISEFFQIPHHRDPRFPDQSISIHRAEFDAVYDLLEREGLPLKDRDEAWVNFAGWRVNYDDVLLALCRLTMAPYAPWSSDRVDTTIFNPRFRGSIMD
jgi:hypothetical protein